MVHLTARNLKLSYDNNSVADESDFWKRLEVINAEYERWKDVISVEYSNNSAVSCR